MQQQKQHQGKLPQEGEDGVRFNFPLEAFCLDKCPFSNHMRAADERMDLIREPYIIGLSADAV